MALNEDSLTAYFLPDLIDDFLRVNNRCFQKKEAVLTRKFGANPMVLVDPASMMNAFRAIAGAGTTAMPDTGGAVTITIEEKSIAAIVSFRFTLREGASLAVPDGARRIVADHHGSIAMQSSGGSAEIIVSIPRHVPSPAFLTNKPLRRVEPEIIEEKMSVLIADDENSIRELLRTILNSLGIRSVKEADNGEDARSMALSGDYDMVFMDVSMPVLSGIDSFRAIRREKPGARIIFITGIYQDEEISDIVEKEGAYGYIKKPFNIMEIRQIVAGVARDIH